MKHIILSFLFLLSVAFFVNAAPSGALDRTGWTATTSLTQNNANANLPNMFDDNLGTDWSSLGTLAVGDWMIIDMKSKQAFNQIVMDQTKNTGDHPEGFEIYVSDDGVNWGDAIYSGKGASAPTTTATFPEKAGRYIKILLTESRGAYWAITEMYVNLVDGRATWTATVSDGWNTSRLPNMFDGDLATDWSTENVLSTGQWMIIDMQAERTFNQIVMDQTTNNGDHAEGFAVYVSNDGENWGEAVATGKGVEAPQTEVTFAEQTARYVKIELTESRGAYWAITELYVNLVKVDYRFGWTATICDRLKAAFDSSGDLPNMFDGSLDTQWSSTAELKDGDWMIIDMKSAQTFNQIILDQTKSPGDSPDNYAVYVSDDGENWGDAVYAGRGTKDQTVATFKEQTARYIKIELGQRGAYWNVTEFNINLVELDYRFFWTATASLNNDNAAKMLDNDLTTDWESGNILTPGDWIIVDMQSEQLFNQIIFTQAITPGDHFNGFEIYVSTDGLTWGDAVATGSGVTGPQTKITFADQTAQYIKIVATEGTGGWAKITEFNINVAKTDNRIGWTATTSLSNKNTAYMFDNDLTTDWESGDFLKQGDWVIIDMKSAQTFNLIGMTQATTPGDCPNGLAVYVSNDGTNWGEAVGTGNGVNGPQTEILFTDFAVQTARYIKIEATEATAGWWKITEFYIKKVDYRYVWTATVSDGWNTSNLPNMFDSDLTTGWSTGDVLKAGQWMIIDMKEPQTFNQVIFDQTIKNSDCPNGFIVYASNDPDNFGEPLTRGVGVNAPETKANITPDQTARYIKIELTEPKGAWWAVTEFNINLVTDKEDYRFGWTMTASPNDNRAMLALDGDLDTKWDSGPMYGDEWIILDMKEAMQFNKIILENSGDYPREYEVFVSNDGENWGEKVGSGLGEENQNEFGQTEIVLKEQTARYIKINQIGLGFGIYWSIFEINIDYDPALSVEQVIEDNPQVYYSNGQIHLQGVSSPSVLNIYNLLGQKVKSIGVNQEVIPVDLNAGVYIITLNNNASYKLLVK